MGYCLTAIVLASCTKDYTDWAEPQANAAHEAGEQAKVTLTVTPATTDVDFATFTDENLKLFSTSLSAQQASDYMVEVSGEGTTKRVSIPATMEGMVASADFQEAVRQLYGRAGYERTLSVTVAAMVKNQTADGLVAVKTAATPFTMKAKLVMPVIAPVYYLLGGPGEWDASKSQVFAHSDKDVDEDPIFTYTFPGGKDMWFAFGDDDAVDTIANGGPWDRLYGTTGGSNDLTGTFDRRYNLGGDNSFHVDGSAPYYRFTINMMEMTYEIEILNSI